MVVSAACLFSSCKNEEKEKIMSQLRQTEIRIPMDSLVCLRPHDRNYLRHHVSNVDYTYIVYCDSTMCSLCELQRMGIWNGIIKKTKEIGASVDFVFVFNPPRRDVAAFINGYYSRRFCLEVFVDTAGVLLRNNAILDKCALHAFILNNSNRIEKVGDASKNAEVEREFYKFLKRKQ